MTRVTKEHGPNTAPSFSPDGKMLAFLGSFGEPGTAGWMDAHVWTIPVAGGDPVDLTPALGRTAGDFIIGDTREAGDGMEPPIWSRDGKQVHFVLSDSGSTFLCRVGAQGGKVERLTPSGRGISGFSADASAGRVALLATTHTRPAEVAVLDLPEGGEPRLLTDHNRAFLESYSVGDPEELWVETAPGVKVQGWILKPFGFEAGKKYPAVIEIHGGPHMMYGNAFFHEMQLLAARGNVVIWTNPQGSQGYGEAFTKAIWKDWGGPDYVDIMKVTDHLAGLPYVDGKRLGVTGGSYGGFMTNWIIGHTRPLPRRCHATQRGEPLLDVRFERLRLRPGRGDRLGEAVGRRGLGALLPAHVAHPLRAQHEDAAAHRSQRGRSPVSGLAGRGTLHRAQGPEAGGGVRPFRGRESRPLPRRAASEPA